MIITIAALATDTAFSLWLFIKFFDWWFDMLYSPDEENL